MRVSLLSTRGLVAADLTHGGVIRFAEQAAGGRRDVRRDMVKKLFQNA
jgi:hypothetical protein